MKAKDSNELNIFFMQRNHSKIFPLAAYFPSCQLAKDTSLPEGVKLGNNGDPERGSSFRLFYKGVLMNILCFAYFYLHCAQIHKSPY